MKSSTFELGLDVSRIATSPNVKKCHVFVCPVCLFQKNRTMSYKEANDVLNYWFGAGDPSKRPKWFGGGEETTEEIRKKFGALVRN